MDSYDNIKETSNHFDNNVQNNTSLLDFVIAIKVNNGEGTKNEIKKFDLIKKENIRTLEIIVIDEKYNNNNSIDNIVPKTKKETYSYRTIIKINANKENNNNSNIIFNNTNEKNK